MWPVPEYFISRELKAPDPVNLRTRPYVDPSEFGADEVEITTRKVSVIKQPEVADAVNPEIVALRRISNYSGTPQSSIEKTAAEPRYLSPTIPIEKRKPDKETINSGTGDYTAEMKNYSSVAVESFTENEV
jgi:hypothetical protein